MNSGLLSKRGGAPRYHAEQPGPRSSITKGPVQKSQKRPKSKSRGRSKQDTPFYTIQDPKYSYGEKVNLAKRFKIVYEPNRTTNENKEVYQLHYTGPGSHCIQGIF